MASFAVEADKVVQYRQTAVQASGKLELTVKIKALVDLDVDGSTTGSICRGRRLPAGLRRWETPNLRPSLQKTPWHRP